MKKVLNIKYLHKILIVLVLCILPNFYLNIKISAASSIHIEQDIIPLKRPIKLNNLEESSDTIYNLTQKVGAKLTAEVKKNKA